MDYYETNRGARVRLILTNEELGLDEIDDLCNKYLEFVSVTKEAGSGRKTRSANKRGDQLFEEIMAYRLPRIKLKHSNDSPILTSLNNNIETNHHQNGTNGCSKTRSTNSSANSSDSSTSRPITRSLRPRSRTPEVQPKRQMSPSTPTHQRLRAHINIKPGSGGVASNGSGDQTASVLTAALNQQHPTVSVTKLRQVLRAESVQKKRIRDDEEKERQERLRSDRKAKEERAEIQKKQLLEERAVNAKLKREQRLLHAAEVRKAREEAKLQQKLKEEVMKEETKQQKLAKDETKRQMNGHVVQQQNFQEKAQETSSKPSSKIHHHNKEEPPIANNKATIKEKNNEKHINNKVKEVKEVEKATEVEEKQPTQKLNETFQKPVDEINNIEIVIQDDSTMEEDVKEKKVVPVATWSKPPIFREALIQQFSKPNFSEYLKRFQEAAPPLMLPVDLKEIFGPRSLGTRALVRTSSAVWSPVHKPLKRSSSMISTPNANSKR